MFRGHRARGWNDLVWIAGLVLAGAPALAAADLDRGKAIYQDRCEICHGAGGRGDGPTGRVLPTRPSDYTSAAFWRGRKDAELLDIIRQGKGLMPKWEGGLSDAEIRDVYAYIKSAFKPE
ncbi:MAG TPA: cytochrome c [Acidobacteriota bacterium]